MAKNWDGIMVMFDVKCKTFIWTAYATKCNVYSALYSASLSFVCSLVCSYDSSLWLFPSFWKYMKKMKVHLINFKHFSDINAILRHLNLDVNFNFISCSIFIYWQLFIDPIIFLAKLLNLVKKSGAFLSVQC